MRVVGELCLLVAFVGSGFAAFVHLTQRERSHRFLRAAGTAASSVSVLALTVVMIILAGALYSKDFSYTYVANYSSKLLPWYYSLSALWVGQAGSLLLWAWLLGLLAMLFRWWPTERANALRSPAFGILMGCLCFLLAVVVFAADPMEANLSNVPQGVGLSPLLQHPAMLIHPPIIFLGYALWTIPFALAAAALLRGELDASWIRPSRTWSLVAWMVLGVGILLGAQWAYEELGWGGYWAWDPVENGSLLPWLTGTVLIHSMMGWQHRRMLKKTALIMAFVTFGLSNFATFLTRSGLFSSLHAFSQSPIGWLFLGFLLVVGIGGGVLLVLRWSSLASEHGIDSVVSREAGVVIGALALLSLAVAVIGGTLSSAVTSAVMGEAMLVGPAFYNNVMIPIGLVLMLLTAAAPLLRWGRSPTPLQRRALLISGIAGVIGLVVTLFCGIRHPIALAVAGLATFAVAAVLSSVVIEARRFAGDRFVEGLASILLLQRRQYAGFLIHLGFVCLVVGITGSSLGKREQGFVMKEGETVAWADRQIRLARIVETKLPDKLVAEAELEITDSAGSMVLLRPAQHYHRLAETWTTEVDIHASWNGDFYTILHSGGTDGQLYMTFVENPLMRFMWLGGAIMVAGTGVRLWPSRRRTRKGRQSHPRGDDMRVDSAVPNIRKTAA